MYVYLTLRPFPAAVIHNMIIYYDINVITISRNKVGSKKHAAAEEACAAKQGLNLGPRFCGEPSLGTCRASLPYHKFHNRAAVYHRLG